MSCAYASKSSTSTRAHRSASRSNAARSRRLKPRRCFDFCPAPDALFGRPIWVVKLGGSLADASELPAWTALLGRRHAVGIVIVPGGGPFADQVRAAQGRWRFPDAIAHRMCVLAMEQFGLLI